jgi:hypothetical protein
VNGAVDSAATEEHRVRGVDDGVHLNASDVTLFDGDAMTQIHERNLLRAVQP